MRVLESHLSPTSPPHRSGGGGGGRGEGPVHGRGSCFYTSGNRYVGDWTLGKINGVRRCSAAWEGGGEEDR